MSTSNKLLGFTLHQGGSAPYGAGTLVDVMHRDGQVFLSVPVDEKETGIWEHGPAKWRDIVAYRLSGQMLRTLELVAGYPGGGCITIGELRLEGSGLWLE